MSMYHDDEPLGEETRKNRGRSCLFVAVAFIVIVSLLSTSVASLIWFWGERTANDQVPTLTIPVTEEETMPGKEPEVDEASTPELAEDTGDDFAVSVAAATQLNRIVIVNEDRQIETIAPDGGDRHLLTDGNQVYEFPTWSPDGRQIAALGNDRDGGGIFLMRDDGFSGEQEELYYSDTQRPFYLYWSPDSKQLSFLANNPTHGIGLNVVKARVGDESREIALGSPLYWNWAADSELLLLHAGNQDEESRLVLIDSAGEDQNLQIQDPGLFQAPGISPSGKYWAYAQLREGGNGWVTVEDRLSGEQTAERHAGAAALNWSPVADKLAFVSGDEDGEFSFWGPLRLIDMDSGETRLLSSDLVLAFFWSPDGTQIFTISVPNLGRLDGGVEVRESKSRHLARIREAVLPMQRLPHQFMLSVINVEDGSGLNLAEVSLSPIFLSQFLVYFDQYALSHNIWSPDSRFIVLPILANGENQIVVLSTDSGRFRSIAVGSMAFWSRQ